MSRRALTLAVMRAWLWVWAGPESGVAHPLNPALLELWESRDAAVEVLWRLPLSQPVNAPLYPVLPDGCRDASAPGFSHTEQSLTARWRLDCGSRSLGRWPWPSGCCTAWASRAPWRR
jgi:hypothetical protein